MAEAKGSNSKKGVPDGAQGGDDAPRVQFKNLWPIPALVLGGALLVGGVTVAMMGRQKPPADIPLEEAKALVQEKRYQEAIEKLNSKEVRNYLDYGNPDEDHIRAFHLARARAFAGAQATLGLNRVENHHAIVEDFEEAEKIGPKELEVGDASLLVESKIAMDDVAGALKRIGSLPEAEAARKTRLTRMVVDHNLVSLTASEGTDTARNEQTLSLLANLSADPSLAPSDRAWVLARQGELLLAAKQPEEAINKLIRRVGLLKDVPLDQQGELYVLLGKAYFQSDQPLEAMKQLEAADTLLEKSSALRADLGIMQARLAQSGIAVGSVGTAENDPTLLLEFAKEKYEGVMTEFGQQGSQYAKALLGLSEVEAALHHDDKSLERYAELVELVNGGRRVKIEPAAGHGDKKEEAAETPRKADGEHGAAEHKEAASEPAEKSHAPAEPAAKEHAATPKASGEHGAAKPHGAPGGADAARVRGLGGLTRERVLASLMQRFHERFDSNQRESALRYASMAESLYKDSEMPAEVLGAIGQTRRAMGDTLMEQAREAHAAAAAQGEKNADFRIRDLDPATRAEVKKNYIWAGDYLRLHAKAIAATDLGEASKSLWIAADSYDRAGYLEEAQRAFADYAAGASDTDPKKSEAKFRLAQVFQAKNPPEFGAAASLYQELVNLHDEQDPTRGSGAWAYKATVPLAQSMLNDNDPANDEEARRLLLSVVDGSRLAPDATEFRDALVELGRSAYKAERFAEAIGWFEQAVKRMKDTRQVVGLEYLLADSHRREGVKIGKTLSTQKLPQAQVDQLETARLEHLSAARGLYDNVRSVLDARDQRTLTGMEKVQLRNSYFYSGDCAMELKSYDGAIAAYDAARNKYADDPASLVAMAQIVSAYAAQEKWAEARTANERARQQLAKFPESVWQNPDLPMEKRHWEKWLEARTLIGQQSAGTEKDGQGER